MIEMFVRTKHKIDKRHEFALVVVNDDAMWVSGQNRRFNDTVILTFKLTVISAIELIYL